MRHGSGKRFEHGVHWSCQSHPHPGPDLPCSIPFLPSPTPLLDIPGPVTLHRGRIWSDWHITSLCCCKVVYGAFATALAGRTCIPSACLVVRIGPGIEIFQAEPSILGLYQFVPILFKAQGTELDLIFHLNLSEAAALIIWNQSFYLWFWDKTGLVVLLKKNTFIIAK